MQSNYSLIELRKYILDLKNEFVKFFNEGIHLLSRCEFVHTDMSQTGSFISLKHPHAIEISSKLWDLGIYTDARNQYLRFGFGVYQDKSDIQKLFKNILL